MRLEELRVRQADPVDWPGTGTTTHMRAEQGYSITLDQGTVTIAKGAVTRIVPWAACAFAVPAREPKK